MGLRNVRSAMYLRFGYPLERRLLERFGKQADCGCETLWGFKRVYCFTHAMEHFGPDD